MYSKDLTMALAGSYYDIVATLGQQGVIAPQDIPIEDYRETFDKLYKDCGYDPIRFITHFYNFYCSYPYIAIEDVFHNAGINIDFSFKTLQPHNKDDDSTSN